MLFISLILYQHTNDVLNFYKISLNIHIVNVSHCIDRDTEMAVSLSSTSYYCLAGEMAPPNSNASFSPVVRIRR